MNFFEHIYIHWPFCHKKCDYCDFLSFVNKERYMQSYHEALCDQITNVIDEYKKIEDFSKKPKVNTIFIGGGTPSLYPLDMLKNLFEVLRSKLDLENVKEITIESNPRDITQEHLKVWSELGINRLSIGVQMMDDQILEKVGRSQKKDDVYRVMKLAPNYFDNISIDLILGLPGITVEKWMNSLSQVVCFPIKHISVYLLTLYKNTRLSLGVESEKISLLKDDKISFLYKKTVSFLEKRGFLQYEISNFAKDGFQSLHNIAYWDSRPYCGFGIGASSFDGASRLVNEKNLNNFLSASKSMDISSFGVEKEKLSRQQRLLEVIMLGLRQKKGVDLHRMLYFLKSDEKERFLQGLKILKKECLVQEIGGKISLTLKGMMLENEVVLRLV